jgi:integrase
MSLHTEQPLAEVIPFKKKKEPRFTKVAENLWKYKVTGEIYLKKEFTAEKFPTIDTPLVDELGNKFFKYNKQAERAKQVMIDQHRRIHRLAKANNRSPKEVVEMLIQNGEQGLLTATTIRKKVHTVSSVIDAFMEKEAKDKAEGTVENYHTYFTKIREKFGDRDINDINRKMFDDWIEEERQKPTERKLKTGTIKKGPPRRTFGDYSKWFNRLLRWAHLCDQKYRKEFIYFPDPDRTFKKSLLEKKKVQDATGSKVLTDDEEEILELRSSRDLSREELKRIIKAMESDSRHGEDKLDQFYCAYLGIMRLREAIEAPWSEIDLQRGVWNLPAHRVKTRTARSFNLHPKLLERLRNRKKRLGDRSKFVFPGWSRKNPGVDKPINQNKTSWKTTLERAGVKDARWHDIRHTALTHAILGDPSRPDIPRATDEEVRHISKSAGVSMKTIFAVYLKGDAAKTRSVTRLLDLDPEEE